MTDRSKRPILFHANVPEAPNEQWQAKREAAKELRELLDVFITSNPDEQQLHNIRDQLNELKQQLSATEQIQGRMAWLQHNHYDSFEHIFHEINAFSGASNPIGPVLECWIDGKHLRGKVNAGWVYEGPPSSMHGGFVAAVMDQFLGTAQTMTERLGMTRYLNIEYHHLTPLEKDLDLIGWVEQFDPEHRKILVKGEIRYEEVLTVSAEALFVIPTHYQTTNLA